VIVLSPVAINSIDIFEAFAGAFAEFEIDGLINLPVFTLEDKIDLLMSEIKQQVDSLEVSA
jgi:hypothetical protein